MGNAAALAVLFVRRTATAWGFAARADLAETLARELVTRAIELTGLADPPPRHAGVLDDPPPLVGVRVSLVRAGLLVAVWDSSSANPLPADPSGLDSRLAVVHECAGRWNAYRAPGGGKVIWAEIPHENTGSGVVLPARWDTRPDVVRAVAVGLRQLDSGGGTAAPREAM